MLGPTSSPRADPAARGADAAWDEDEDEAPEDEAVDLDGEIDPALTEGWAGRHLRVLQYMARVGVDLIQSVETEVGRVRDAAGACEAEASEPAAERRQALWQLGRTLNGTMRSVSVALALEARVQKSLSDGRGGQYAPPEWVKGASERLQDRLQAMADDQAPGENQQVVEDVVKAMIDAETQVELRASRLLDGLYARLEDPTAYGDVETRPVGEVIASLCRDLGLSPDWRQWAHEAWAVREAREEAPGSPFAAGGEAAAAGFEPPPDADPPDPAAKDAPASAPWRSAPGARGTGPP